MNLTSFSKQRDLAVKMRRLFQERPFRAHGKSNVAAADRLEPHFRLQIESLLYFHIRFWRLPF